MAARLTAYVVVAIVAATLIAGLIVGAQRDDNDGPVDLIVTNATVYTADRRGTTAEAVAVRGNQILRVGTAREIARLQRPQTIVVDAGGGVVLPGFNDAHVDMIAGGLELAVADLSDAATAEEALDRVRTWSAANPRAAVGHRQRLDAGPVPQRPADAPHARRRRQGPAGALLRFGRERAVGVGELAGAEARRHHPDDPGSARRHRARGAERRTLRRPAWNGRRGPRGAGARPSPEDRLQALRRAIAEANTRGITSAQNTAADCEKDVDLFDSIRRDARDDPAHLLRGSRRPFSDQGRIRSRALQRAARQVSG